MGEGKEGLTRLVMIFSRRPLDLRTHNDAPAGEYAIQNRYQQDRADTTGPDVTESGTYVVTTSATKTTRVASPITRNILSSLAGPVGRSFTRMKRIRL